MDRKEASATASAGFTLVEVLVVTALLLPMLIAIATTTGLVQNSMSVNEVRGDLSRKMHRVAEDVGRLMRSAALSTMEHRHEPGEAWHFPTELVTGVSLRFRHAEGLLSINATSLSSLRTLEFVLEPGETDNGLDDDGDGLVDEGSLMQFQDGISWRLARDVEFCTFTLEGRVMRFVLTCAREVDGRILRATVRRSCFIRNN